MRMSAFSPRPQPAAVTWAKGSPCPAFASLASAVIGDLGRPPVGRRLIRGLCDAPVTTAGREMPDVLCEEGAAGRSEVRDAKGLRRVRCVWQAYGMRMECVWHLENPGARLTRPPALRLTIREHTQPGQDCPALLRVSQFPSPKGLRKFRGLRKQLWAPMACVMKVRSGPIASAGNHPDQPICANRKIGRGASRQQISSHWGKKVPTDIDLVS